MSDRKIIAGEEYISVKAAAEYLGCCRAVLDTMMAKSARGQLRPPLEWFRYKPRSPIWFRKAFLAKWAEERSRMKA